MSTPKPYPTLPEPAQRDTKRKRATMQRFNEAIDDALRTRGAELDREYPLTPDSLIGYAMRYWRIETPAGPLQVMPSGTGVMCRFDDPERAVRACVSGCLNEHSGKWNHNYFGEPHDDAVSDFTSQLDRVLALRRSR